MKHQFDYIPEVMLPGGVTIVPCEFINQDITVHLDEIGCDTGVFYIFGDHLYSKIFGSRNYMQVTVK